MHEGGYRYGFVNGIENPVLHEFPEHINGSKKYGLQYLDENGRGVGDIPIHELFKDGSFTRRMV